MCSYLNAQNRSMLESYLRFHQQIQRHHRGLQTKSWMQYIDCLLWPPNTTREWVNTLMNSLLDIALANFDKASKTEGSNKQDTCKISGKPMNRLRELATMKKSYILIIYRLGSSWDIHTCKLCLCLRPKIWWRRFTHPKSGCLWQVEAHVKKTYSRIHSPKE